MPPPVSVIVASHGRPQWLSRCLTALGQLDYPTFEIVIAADAAGLDAVAGHRHGAHVKTVRHDTPNISETRNAGIAQAAGDVLAFIDDDAVPEPLWLRHHADALEATGADASVGYVRGRNGITFQSKTASIDAQGETHPLPSPPVDPAVPVVPNDQALKLVGTNFTVSRAAICAIGGFDPAFRFFLDDSDVSLRLARAGYVSAVAPLAEVHHGVAPSHNRSASRFPRCLYDIARSTAILLRKHGATEPETIFARLENRERARLVRHMVQGTCEPRDIASSLMDLTEGWTDGQAVDLYVHRLETPQPAEFKSFPAELADHRLFTSRLPGRARMRRIAAETADSGQRVTAFSFSLTPARHHLRYREPGVWEQTGGLFGPSTRTQPIWRWCRFAQRVNEEIARVEMQRGIGDNGTRVG